MARTISLQNPPAGWVILRNQSDLQRLCDPAVQAATLLPRDPVAALFMCEQLEHMTLPTTWQNDERRVTETTSYYREQGEIIPVPRAITASLFAHDPRLQAAFMESLAIGTALAHAFMQADGHYVNGQISAWHGFAVTGQLHRDAHTRAPIALTHNICLRPTIIAIDGGYWQGPPATHNFFKACGVWHCADRTQPQRPHVQLGHDVVRVIENTLD